MIQQCDLQQEKPDSQPLNEPDNVAVCTPKISDGGESAIGLGDAAENVGVMAMCVC
jgi:hypothetical protein